jgi:hypothetical protein
MSRIMKGVAKSPRPPTCLVIREPSITLSILPWRPGVTLSKVATS